MPRGDGGASSESSDGGEHTPRASEINTDTWFATAITPSTGQTSLATSRTSPSPGKTLAAWAQAVLGNTTAPQPTTAAIANALVEMEANPVQQFEMSAYDQVLSAFAQKGEQMLLAPSARRFLNEHLPRRLEMLQATNPQDAQEALKTLGRMRKLATGRAHARAIGELVVRLTEDVKLQKTMSAWRMDAPAAATSQAPAAAEPSIVRDTYGWAVRASRIMNNGDASWSVLRAVSDSPNVAGVVVGAMGAALGRGAFAKVKPFVFAAGFEPQGHQEGMQYVARVTRTVRDREKENLRFGDPTFKRYHVSTPDMVEGELHAMEAVGSELSPVATWLDDKGRRVDVVRYFERSLQELGRVAPELVQNGAFLHDVCSSLLLQLSTFKEAGQVHLDIKPANILYDYSRMFAAFGDFGLARRLGEVNRQSGTPLFMAPEMRRMDFSRVDNRSDLYSLAYSLASLVAPGELSKSPMVPPVGEAFSGAPMAKRGPVNIREQRYEQWWTERFGSPDARFSLADLRGHKQPFDRLFKRIANVNVTVAQLVAAGLRGDPSLRGTAEGWQKMFAQEAARIPAGTRRDARLLVAGLAASEREQVRSNVFERLKQFVSDIDTIKPLGSVFSDDSDETSPGGESDEEARSPEPAAPRGRSLRRRQH